MIPLKAETIWPAPDHLSFSRSGLVLSIKMLRPCLELLQETLR